MSTGYSWKGITQVRATLLGARHVPERLCGGHVYLGRYIKCSTFTFYPVLHGSSLRRYRRPRPDWYGLALCHTVLATSRGLDMIAHSLPVSLCVFLRFSVFKFAYAIQFQSTCIAVSKSQFTALTRRHSEIGVNSLDSIQRTAYTRSYQLMPLFYVHFVHNDDECCMSQLASDANLLFCPGDTRHLQQYSSWYQPVEDCLVQC